MRKINSFMMIAASVLAIASCSKAVNEPVSKDSTRTIRFVANEIQTKTVFGEADGNTYPVLWTDGAKVKFKVGSSTQQPFDVDVNSSADKKSATFKFLLPEPFNVPYFFRCVTPSVAAASYSSKMWQVDIPASQTPTAASVDETAQILAAWKQFDATVDSPEKLPAVINLDFEHVTAYGKISIKNLASDAGAVSKIVLDFGANVVGRFNFNDGALSASSASNKLTINTTSLQDVWFACAPAEVAGTQMTVTVVAGENSYSKTVTLPAGRNFVAGRIAKFSVDFAGVNPEGYVPPVEPVDLIYAPVTDLSQLTNGSKVIFINIAGKFAMGGPTADAIKYSSVSVVSETDGSLKNPSADVNVLTLTENTNFPGCFSFVQSDGNALLSSYIDSKSYLQTGSLTDERTAYIVEIAADGTAHIQRRVPQNHPDEVEPEEHIFIKFNTNTKLFNSFPNGNTQFAFLKLLKLVE